MGRLAPGARLGADLTLGRRLGAGGVAEAWLARDRAGRMLVAKVLRPGGFPDGGALLEREARLAQALAHPTIVPVLGSGSDGDLAWLVLDYVPGGDAGRVRGGDPAAVLRALLPVVDALEHAHARGVVHRDVKASNVLLDEQGRGRLGDFGVAARLSPGPGGDGLAGGGSRGSMSPQQLDGEPPHPADDVYGLGALLYDLLEGHPPFWPDFDPERVRREAPPPLGRHSEGLGRLVAGMLAKRREERPSLDEVREGMRAGLDGIEAAAAAGRRRDVALVPPPRVEELIAPVPLPLPARTERGSRAVREGRGPVLLLFAGLAAVAAGVFFVLPRLVAKAPGGDREGA